MSCDRFLGRTHAPRTSRLRCARTRVRTPNLKWSHFAPAPALLVKKRFSAIFQSFLSNFMVMRVLKQNKVIQNRKGHSKAGKDVVAFSDNFVPKSVQKCGRTSHAQKMAARTHIPHTFQNGFCTHTHTCDRTSHVRVRACTFVTHSLIKSSFSKRVV